MKKEMILQNARGIIFAAFFLIFSLSASAALDFGGLLTNESAFQTYFDEKFKLDQKNSVSLWARQNFDKTGENFFIAEGNYNFEGDFEKENDDERFSHALDLAVFSANLSNHFDSSKINFTAGRFYFSDISGIIFTQNADGAKFDFQNSYFKISAYGAYTGFLNALNIKIISAKPAEMAQNGNMPATQDKSKIFIADSDKIYDFAEKYAAAALTLSFPFFAANQSATAEFLGTFRLENEKYNRMYATLSFDGPLYNSLFYDFSSTFEFINYEQKDENGNPETKNDVSNLSKIGIYYYFSKASLGLSGIYASGNQGAFSPFLGFTKNTSTYSLQEFLYSGIIKGGANATFKPFENFLLSANCDLIFNALAGDKNDGEMEKIKYYGFEYSAGVTWQVKSDFQLGVTASQFLDKDNSDLATKTYINLHAALAF